jgi:glycosyltransferase involved in cell wall biosynthesis
MPDVIFALTGDVRHNSRALRQLRSLADLGASVQVLTLGDTHESTQLQPEISLRPLERPPGRGPLFFWRVHQRFRRAARSMQASTYHASDLYTLPAMSAAAGRYDGTLVFDSRELYPHVASTQNRPWVRWFWKAIESIYIPRTDAVFTVNESIARRLQDSYGIEPPVVLYNAPAYEEATPSNYLHDRTGVSRERVLILHQGSMQRDRGCEHLIRAMETIHHASLVFLGSGPLKEKLEAMAVRRRLQERVYFVPPVPPDDLLAVTASADIGVTLLQDTCENHRLALPNKLFEYLMAGLPVVASDLPEVGAVVRKYEVGLTVTPDDVVSVAAGLQKLVDQPELRSTMAARTPGVFDEYSWENGKEKFTEIYSKLLTQA